MAKRTTKSAGGRAEGGDARAISAETRLAIFHGDDDYLQGAHTEQLRGSLREAFGEIELVRFDGKTTGVAEVLDECRSFGLMTSHKLVIVDHAKEWLAEDGGDEDEGGSGAAGGSDWSGDDDDDDRGEEAGDDEAGGSAGDEGDAAGSVEEDTATMALFGGGDDGGASGGGSSAGAGDAKGTTKSERPAARAVARRTLRKRELVERYAESPPDSATLVLRGKGLVPGRLKAAFEAHGVVIKCDAPKADNAAVAVRRRMREQHGRTLSPEAAEALVERVGVMLGRLVHEVDKLALAVEPGREITVDDVAAMVGLTREQQNWELKKALLSGDPARTIGLMHELLTVSRVPMQLIRWNFLDLAKALYALGESAAGRSGGVSPRALRLWGEEERRAMGIVRSAPLARLRALLDAAVEADYRAKTGQGNEIRALEVLAVEFASLGR